MDESYRLRRDEVPSVFLWQELPFVLFDKHFDAGLQFLDIILFEKPEIAFDAIIVIDPLLLHHAVVTFIASNQDRHRTSSSVLPRYPLVFEPGRCVTIRQSLTDGQGRALRSTGH